MSAIQTSIYNLHLFIRLEFDQCPIFSRLHVRLTRSLVLCVCFVDRCLSFCTFYLLTTALSILLRYTDSFGIFKLFSIANSRLFGTRDKTCRQSISCTYTFFFRIIYIYSSLPVSNVPWSSMFNQGTPFYNKR